MTYLLVFALHMLASEHTSYTIQLVKFTDLASCQEARPTQDGVTSVCTTNVSDATAFVAAMNCGNPEKHTVAGTEVLAYSCSPDIKTPRG